MHDLNMLAAEIHSAAVEKGFWAVEEAEEKHIAKMHGELSEALQEDRCGRPLLYVDDIEVSCAITDPAQFDGRKPEGVAAELADFVMMLLDWAKARDVVIDDYIKEPMSLASESLPYFVKTMHEGIVLVSIEYVKKPEQHYAYMARCVEMWLRKRGVDLWEVIRLKMEYNKSRPALHGRLY